jgi:hypothetical protein
VLIWVQYLIGGLFDPLQFPPVQVPPVPSIWIATCEATPSPKLILVVLFVFAPAAVVPMIGDEYADPVL